MTPNERSRKALENVDIRRMLEESNLPVEIATAIADRLEQPEATAGSKLEEELAMLVRRLAARIRLRSKTGPHATPDNATFHIG
jgi:hypothetical protein